MIQAAVPPLFDRRVCSSCGAPCVDACPQSALAIVGERMTTDQVMANIIADKAFYDNSGGGVTFSGGEPFAQPAFLEELLDQSKQLGIHTAVETCGQADPHVVSKCEPLVDLFLYDLKAWDSVLHERFTGVPNTTILENLRALAAKAPDKIAVRVPIVPGCTEDAANLKAIATFLYSLGIARVELMPYHTLGVDKYSALGRDYPLADRANLSSIALHEASQIFLQNGLACDIGI